MLKREPFPVTNTFSHAIVPGNTGSVQCWRGPSLPRAQHPSSRLVDFHLVGFPDFWDCFPVHWTEFTISRFGIPFTSSGPCLLEKGFWPHSLSPFVWASGPPLPGLLVAKKAIRSLIGAFTGFSEDWVKYTHIKERADGLYLGSGLWFSWHCDLLFLYRPTEYTSSPKP